jgi:hypothetical protein
MAPTPKTARNLFSRKSPWAGENIRPLLKNEWVPPKIGPLLFIDRMVSNDAVGYALVKAEAAAGGGRRPAFTRA